MRMADVAVLMTVYNGMPFLLRSVESVLEQTLGDFHFVIVHDSSIDGTVDYLSGWYHRSARAGLASGKSGHRCRGESRTQALQR